MQVQVCALNLRPSPCTVLVSQVLLVDALLQANMSHWACIPGTVIAGRNATGVTGVAHSLWPVVLLLTVMRCRSNTNCHFGGLSYLPYSNDDASFVRMGLCQLLPSPPLVQLSPS